MTKWHMRIVVVNPGIVSHTGAKSVIASLAEAKQSSITQEFNRLPRRAMPSSQ